MSNRDLSAEDLQRRGRFRAETISRWEEVMRSRRLSMRSGLHLLRVSRLVTNLRGSEEVSTGNLASAVCFISFDVAEPWS